MPWAIATKITTRLGKPYWEDEYTEEFGYGDSMYHDKLWDYYRGPSGPSTVKATTTPARFHGATPETVVEEGLMQRPMIIMGRPWQAKSL